MIMDSCFSVLKWLIGMYEIVVYGRTVLKKRRYWLSGINGYQINAHFEKNEIGEHDQH